MGPYRNHIAYVTLFDLTVYQIWCQSDRNYDSDYKYTYTHTNTHTHT